MIELFLSLSTLAGSVLSAVLATVAGVLVYVVPNGSRVVGADPFQAQKTGNSVSS